MKIMYVDLEYDYGDPDRGSNFIGQLGFKQSLESLGHEVVPFYYDTFLYRTQELQGVVLERAEAIDPDLIFFCLFRDQFAQHTLDQLKDRWLTVNWFGDDTWRFDEFTRHYALHFSYAITTDKYSLYKYRILGVANVILSQWAAIDFPHKTSAHMAHYKYDVSFVGAVNPYRKWFVDQLARKGVEVACFGHGWPAGIIPLEDMVDIFSASRINLNLSNRRSLDLRFLLSGPRNILDAIRSTKLRDVVRARNFEISFYGGFQMAEYTPGLEDYLDIGKDLVCYKDVDEAEFLIRFYLEHDVEREMIRDRGISRCIDQHTYQNRFQHILERISGDLCKP